MKKGVVLLLLFVGLLAAVLCQLHAWVAPGQRVFARLPRVAVGMRTAQVRALLGPPDTTYVWPEAPHPQVLQYDMGPLAPDDVRVLVMNDSVTGVAYAQ